MTEPYRDYLLRYRLTDQSLALQAISALIAQGLMSSGETPGWMLGDQVICDTDGNIIARGGAGTPAKTDADGNKIQANGDPEYFYMAIRTTNNMPFTDAQLSSYGLEYATANNIADWMAVLGVFS